MSLFSPKESKEAKKIMWTLSALLYFAIASYGYFSLDISLAALGQISLFIVPVSVISLLRWDKDEAKKEQQQQKDIGKTKEQIQLEALLRQKERLKQVTDPYLLILCGLCLLCCYIVDFLDLPKQEKDFYGHILFGAFLLLLLLQPALGEIKELKKKKDLKAKESFKKDSDNVIERNRKD